MLIALSVMSVLSSCKRGENSVTTPPDVSDTTTFQDSVDFTPKVGLSVIKGQVLDCTLPVGVPLAGVRVVLDSPLYGAMTDNDGRFVIPATPGTHTLWFTKEGYAPVNYVNIRVYERDTTNATPDTIPLNTTIKTAHKPSYQPVNLEARYGYDAYSKNRGVIITGARKLIIPEAYEPLQYVARVYREDPKQHANAEFVYYRPVYYRMDEKDSNGNFVVSVSLTKNPLAGMLGLKVGDTCYITLQFASSNFSIGTYDLKKEKMIYTAVGPESEPLKIVVE